MVMNILREILLGVGLDGEVEYFSLSLEDRERVVNKLWDEVYGPSYKRSLERPEMDSSLYQQIQILNFLFNSLKEFEEIEQFEVCDVVYRLIEITEDKINEIDKHYADTK